MLRHLLPASWPSLLLRLLLRLSSVEMRKAWPPLKASCLIASPRESIPVRIHTNLKPMAVTLRISGNGIRSCARCRRNVALTNKQTRMCCKLPSRSQCLEERDIGRSIRWSWVLSGLRASCVSRHCCWKHDLRQDLQVTLAAVPLDTWVEVARAAEQATLHAPELLKSNEIFSRPKNSWCLIKHYN